MDEEYTDSVDISADIDVSDVEIPADISADIPVDIPDDVPEDISEENYAKLDTSDELLEDTAEHGVLDGADHNKDAEYINEDVAELKAEEIDEFADGFEEDSFADETVALDQDERGGDISEDIDEAEVDATNDTIEVDDIPEDTDESGLAVQEAKVEEDLAEDIEPPEQTEALLEEDAIEDESVENAEQPEADKQSEMNEINSISDYMNAHNYGKNDFDTYSQDPQWRQLMRQEYPDYELPELSQESANDQLSQYMNDHNYSIGDYSEYSQDPIWRELHSAAFPDNELPPLNDTSQDQLNQSVEDVDAKDIDSSHPTCPICGQYPCICDIRDDQGNYPTLKSMENKEYFEAARSSYEKAEDVAGESGLKFFKAHDMDHHIDKVIERSAEASDVIEEVADARCDKKDLAVAALYHDTGMDGGEKYEVSDGDSIRKNHPMSSAIHVLNNRDALENDGCNVEQVAALTLLHSKSCSGVRNLADHDQIEEAFSKLQEEVDSYNVAHPDSQVSFNKDAIDIEKFKYNAAALRLGDAYGHDSSSTKTQSDAYYDIDFGEGNELSHEEWGEEYWKDEISDSNLIFHGREGSYRIDDSNDAEGYTRMYQFGEGNIASMHSRLGEEGEFQSVIDINNGMAKPLCTQECILERLKELKTTSELFPYSTTINLYGECDEKHRTLYESFSRENEAEFGRIRINYVGGKYNGSI